MIHSLIYYIFSASIVLMYGIGINRTTAISLTDLHSFGVDIVKAFFSIIITTVLTWLIIKWLLIPMHLIGLYPFIALLIFVSINVFIEILIRIISGHHTSEFAVSYLIILLSLNESCSIVDAVLIPVYCLSAFVIIIPILYSLRIKIESTRLRNSQTVRESLIFISIAILILITAAGNISWLNPEVLP